MTLRRTPSALHSLHRFFQVDIVAFCEGGLSVDYNTAISRDHGDQSTLDVMFWQNVVHQLGLNKKYHFKSVGSKQTLKSICDDVQRHGISSISVCLDRDYDSQLNRLHVTDRICYTYGYSWENDVLSEPVVEAIVRDFIGVGEIQNDELQLLRQKLSSFRDSLSYWIEIDIALARLGKPGVFLRSNPNTSLDFAHHPSLRIPALQNALREIGYKTRPKRCVRVDCGSSLYVCFGKLVSHAVFHCIGDLFERFGVRKLAYDQFMRLAISRTFQFFGHADLRDISVNFQTQVRALH